MADSGGSAANGSYDLTFALFNAGTGGSQVGGSVTNLAVGVTNGLFTTTLDFGGVFTGNATWLAIGVRTNNSANTLAFAPLTPLQALTPTPYEIFIDNILTKTSQKLLLTRFSIKCIDICVTLYYFICILLCEVGALSGLNFIIC